MQIFATLATAILALSVPLAAGIASPLPSTQPGAEPGLHCDNGDPDRPVFNYNTFKESILENACHRFSDAESAAGEYRDCCSAYSKHKSVFIDSTNEDRDNPEKLDYNVCLSSLKKILHCKSQRGGYFITGHFALSMESLQGTNGCGGPSSAC